MKLTHKLACAAAFLLALGTGSVSANDADPRAFRALPAGTNLGMLYFRNIQNESGADVDLSANIGLFRSVHYRDFMGKRAAFQFIVPFGSQRLATAGPSFTSSGLTDPIVSAGIWPVSNGKTDVVVLGYLALPLGNDDDTPTSMGGNRFAFTPQIGVFHAASPKWTFGGSLDATFFTNDDRTDRDQDPNLQLNLTSTYKLTDKFSLGGRYSARRIGETTVAGVAQDNEHSITQVSAYGIYQFDPGFQGQLRVTQDIHNGGPVGETRAFELRFVKVF